MDFSKGDREDRFPWAQPGRMNRQTLRFSGLLLTLPLLLTLAPTPAAEEIPLSPAVEESAVSAPMEALFTPASVEVFSGDVYCLSAESFGADLVGICLTQIPRNKGSLCLGSRDLRPGDVLTAQQLSQLTFSPLPTVTDQTAQVEFLPIFSDRVAEPQTLTVSIRGREDRPPVAEDSSLETYKNLSNTALFKATDPECQKLTFTLVRQPRRGTLELHDDGTFTYTPKKNKVGVDSFTYTATDPAGNVSREATVTVTILKPTDAAHYTDTQGRQCRFEAEWMRHTGIFAGETVGQAKCFSPDREVTRGEFVTMLVKALDLPTDQAVTYTGYDDQVPAWLQPYLAAAVRAGLTVGLEDPGIFDANRVLTESEAALLLQNALSVVPAFSPQPGAALTREVAAQLLYQAAKTAQA